MQTNTLQQLKRAWLDARTAGDKRAQFALLRDHPEAQEELLDFIAAYSATELPVPVTASTDLLPLTQRAYQSALERVFGQPQTVAAISMPELRAARGLSLVSAARGLRLGVDVWKKFESGAIELASLSERQLQRLASFFQVSVDQFGTMLNHTQPTLALNRRQTEQAARSEQQAPTKQSFSEAVQKSAMTKEDKRLWLGE